MMTTATQTTEYIFTARCKAFSGDCIRLHKLKAEAGSKQLRVWDDIAGYYTYCHSLSARTQARLIAAHTFRFATDAESGTMFADDFSDAKWKLREMLPANIIADGGFGWVADHDGYRYEIGERC
jgi:hypothetical protein